MGDRWGEVLEELPRVREALGWPIMVTPLSQFIGVQAFLNVTTGKRWSQIPDEIVKYVLGQYGPPPGSSIPRSRRSCSRHRRQIASDPRSTGSIWRMLALATAIGSETRSCCYG